MISGAVFSQDSKKTYRYSLWRELDGDRGPVLFIMLNPSTANATKDDPTVRRCIGYAKMWGHRKLYVGNIFSYRATDPRQLKKADEPIGPLNNTHLVDMAKDSELVIAAWGTHGNLFGRGMKVWSLMSHEGIGLSYLRMTKFGHPSHPLYLSKNIKPKNWVMDAG